MRQKGTGLAERLVALLADGRFQSGEQLGRTLKLSRGAVWKGIKRLADWGLDVQAVRGKGYRMAEPIELLDPVRIQRAIGPSAQQLISSLEVFSSIESTNGYLMHRLRQQQLCSGHVCVAEYQSAGRGRRGRHWRAGYAGSILASVYWRFPGGPVSLGGLSLALGVSVADALRVAGVDDVGLKWPNDVYRGGRKLGGILVEVTGESEGPSHTVIGIGLNMRLGALRDEIGQPCTDVLDAGTDVGRNELTGVLLERVMLSLERYQSLGLEGFLGQWRDLDVLEGKEVRVISAEGALIGRAAGIDSSGRLRVDVEGKTLALSSGEVSVRGTGGMNRPGGVCEAVD